MYLPTPHSGSLSNVCRFNMSWAATPAEERANLVCRRRTGHTSDPPTVRLVANCLRSHPIHSSQIAQCVERAPRACRRPYRHIVRTGLRRTPSWPDKAVSQANIIEVSITARCDGVLVHHAEEGV